MMTLQVPHAHRVSHTIFGLVFRGTAFASTAGTLNGYRYIWSLTRGSKGFL